MQCQAPREVTCAEKTFVRFPRGGGDRGGEVVCYERMQVNLVGKRDERMF